MGNACPLFFATDLVISQIRSLSDGKHVKLILSSGEYTVEAVGFNMGELLDILKEGDKVVYQKYSTTEVKVNGEEFLMIKQNDILAIIVED